MKKLSFIPLICTLAIMGIATYTYGEETPKPDAPSRMARATERAVKSGEPEEDVEGTEEFDEIVGQLQGMKAALEKMRRDYDATIKELQERIVTMEKEKKQLIDKDLEAARPAELRKEETRADQVDKDTYHDVAKRLERMEKEYSARMEEMQEKIAVTKPSSTPDTGKWSPAQPITLMSAGKSYMNISFDGLFAAAGSTAKDVGSLNAGGHDANQRGFTVQNLETTFDGAIDPYFKGQANIIFQIDNEGESLLEVEEAFLASMSLPLNLQAKAGTFFTEFGRLNPFHPHAWDFADQPLVNGRFLGPDGLRGPGARLSWLAPTSNYTELFFTVQNSQGETAHSFRNEEALFGRAGVETSVRGMEDMLYTPRITTSFDVTDETTVLLGASAAFGPNSTGTDKDTLIYGLDMFWKWKPGSACGGFPFVTWQTEVMGRRFEAGEDVDAGLPDETMDNWGAYSQIAWGFKKRWVAGLRGDYVDGEEEASDPLGLERYRVSPNLTFFPSEFSKIRLQYNYDDILGNDTSEHTVAVQFEFLLGSHGAHKF